MFKDPIDISEYDSAYDPDIEDQFEYLNYAGPNWISADRIKFKAISNVYTNVAEYSLLDFGCGEGRFLRSISNLHPNAFGFEVSKPITNPDVKIINDQAELLEYIRHKKIIVTLFEVIEHIDDLGLLQLIWQNAKECIFWGTTGDHGSFLAKLGGQKWPYLMPQHCTIYTKATFRHLGNRLGSAQVTTYRGYGFGPELIQKSAIINELPVGHYKTVKSLWKWRTNITSSITFNLKKTLVA